MHLPNTLCECYKKLSCSKADPTSFAPYSACQICGNEAWNKETTNLEQDLSAFPIFIHGSDDTRQLDVRGEEWSKHTQW